MEPFLRKAGSVRCSRCQGPCGLWCQEVANGPAGRGAVGEGGGMTGQMNRKGIRILTQCFDGL